MSQTNTQRSHPRWPVLIWCRLRAEHRGLGGRQVLRGRRDRRFGFQFLADAAQFNEAQCVIVETSDSSSYLHATARFYP